MQKSSLGGPFCFGEGTENLLRLKNSSPLVFGLGTLSPFCFDKQNMLRRSILVARCACTLLYPHNKKSPEGLLIVRVPRIELGSRPWQGRILPLNHTRKHSTSIQIFLFFGRGWGRFGRDREIGPSGSLFYSVLINTDINCMLCILVCVTTNH